MISVAYKNRLIKRLRQVNDESVLKEIESSLDKAEQKMYTLSEEEINAVNVSEEQIKIGKILTSEEAKSKRSEWL